MFDNASGNLKYTVVVVENFLLDMIVKFMTATLHSLLFYRGSATSLEKLRAVMHILVATFRRLLESQSNFRSDVYPQVPLHACAAAVNSLRYTNEQSEQGSCTWIFVVFARDLDLL